MQVRIDRAYELCVEISYKFIEEDGSPSVQVSAEKHTIHVLNIYSVEEAIDTVRADTKEWDGDMGRGPVVNIKTLSAKEVYTVPTGSLVIAADED